MLPTFVIGLREGLEAALIVGIVAAFLRKEGRDDALKPMWTGVAIAVAICAAVAIGLDIANAELPQRQQEGLETVVGTLAVGVVTFMIVWMRRHSRGLKGELQKATAGALASGSTWALIGMAFFAVIREGFETAVFLIAAFNASTNSTDAGIGAALGVTVAIVLGYGIYKGGVHINLQKFFRATAAVLVLVAAGLVATASHTAHEAGWISSMQGQAVDLTWLVKPGTVTASLLTGMLGLQPKPTHIEAVGYVVYALPMLLFVLWPERLRPRFRSVVRGTAAGMTIVALTVLLSACGSSSSTDKTVGGARTVRVSITDAGCEPAVLKIPAGPANFVVSAKGSGKSTEFEVLKGTRILGEKENLAPGLSGSFSLKLAPGDYTTKCTGADREQGKLTVTAATASAPGSVRTTAALRTATEGYRMWVEAQCVELLARTGRFVAAVKNGDLAEAKQLYPLARGPYESIEPVAESFGDLDPRIDARVNDVAPGQKWTGFHRIEQALWKRHTTKGMSAIADQLLTDVKDLQAKVARTSYQPAELANGATGLLGEVSKSKITGEEDRYSHTDLWDFEANVAGALQAFQLLKPALDQRNRTLARQITERFSQALSALSKYRLQDGGFKLYGELSKSDVRGLSQKIDALAEPLSKVAAAVVTS